VNIKVSVDVDQVVGMVSTVLRQLPYATNNALTRTAKEAVDAGRNALRSEVTVRKSFIVQRIKILQYSKVNNLTVVIGVDANVQGAPLLLGFLEEGGTKEPTSGSGIAIPLTGEAARPTFSQSVGTGFRYQNLQFVGNKGRLGTYIVPNVGIFKRLRAAGPRRKGYRNPTKSILIYSFKPSAFLPIHTHIRAAMVELINARFSQIWTEEFTKEVLKRAEHIR
jgi:hypothetical protein